MRDIPTTASSRGEFVSWEGCETFSYWTRDQLSQIEQGVVVRVDGMYLGRA